ncbi:MAG: sugar phosphate nucleotidyltransferase [Patescibacteria group bacterium]|nr:sugar phosphate nucleotidyltransferase [Patescibacteria group bacterium]
MIKKVVISAAGRGTRMGKLTDDKPKHLLEIAGQPFLYYLLHRLEAAGFSEMIMVVGYKKEAFNDFIKKYPFNLKIVDQHEMCGDDYGTAIPIKAVKNLIGQENFVSVAGDNLYSVRDLKKSQKEDKLNYIGGLKVNDGGRFGHLEVDGRGFLQDIKEKPENISPGERIINCSLYKFTPEIFGAIDRIGLSPREEYEITEAITYLAEERKVKLIELEDFWLDFGRPEDIEKLAKHLREK